ncbi:MAG: putative peptide zinc metalloprotease protein [Actinomycetota bacterium]
MIRRLLLAAALAATVAVPLAPGHATAQSDSAVAVNKHDGKSVFKLAFHVRKTMDSDVDAQNAAVAYASCTDCRTVAASIQVVLAMGDVDSATPENVSIAINDQCSECETLAAAYQYVFGTGEPMKFTAEGNRKLADIRHRLHELQKRDDLTLDELAAEIAKLAAETAEVVDTELVPRNQPASQESTTTTSSSTSSTLPEPGGATTTTADANTTTTGP